jgi:hypothetical protein
MRVDGIIAAWRRHSFGVQPDCRLFLPETGVKCEVMEYWSVGVLEIKMFNILNSCPLRFLADSAFLFNRKDRAKRYRKSSIFNLQSSIPACPGWTFQAF